MEQLNTFSNNATRQIIETVRTVQGMPKNSLPSKSNPRRSLKARITATIDDPGNPGTPLEFEFEAEQVSWDGSAWQAITNGKEWDSTKPLYVDSGGVVGDVLTADPVSNGANSTVWLAIKPAGGGGDTKVWAKITSGSLKSYLGDIYDDPIETNPALFTGANVYAHNVDFGSVNVGAILPTDLIGSTYYVYPATFGG